MNRTITLSLLFAVIASSNAQTSSKIEKDIKFGKYDVAKNELYKLIKTEPTQGTHYYNLGKIHLIENNQDSANIYFKNGLRATKNASLNNIGLGEIALNTNKEKEARSKFNGAFNNLKKDDISMYLLAAQTCLDAKNKDFERALEYTNKAIKIQPKSVEAYVMLGDIYLADKSPKLALSSYREALKNNPKSPLALMKITSVSIYNKDYGTAVEKLNEVIQNYPDFEEAYKQLAIANYLWNKEEKDSNKINNATKAYKKYHELIGQSIDSDNNYAEFLIKIKDFKTLDEFAKSNWELRGDNFPIYKFAAISAYQNGNYKDALTQIEKYFDVERNSEKFVGLDYMYLGLSEIANAKQANGTFEKNAYEKGLANIKKGISLDHSLAEEMNAYAIELFKDGNYEQAYYLFELGSLDKTSPNYVYDNYYKGNCLFLTNETPLFNNQLQKASEAFDLAIKASSTTHEALLMNARTNRFINTDASKVKMAKNYEDFITVISDKKMLKDADMKEPLIESYMFLGTYYKEKDANKARNYFSKVIEIQPNHEYSLKQLQKIKG